MNFYEKLLNLNGASANVRCGGVLDDESNFDPIYVPTALQVDFAVDLNLVTDSDAQMEAYVQRMVSGLKAAVSGRRKYSTADMRWALSAGMFAYQMYRALNIAIEASATILTDTDSLTLFNVSGNTNQWCALRERVETLLDIVPITQEWADWFDAQFGIRKLKAYAGDTPLIMMPTRARTQDDKIVNLVDTDFDTAFGYVMAMLAQVEEIAQINADIRYVTGMRDYRSRMNHLLTAEWTDDMAAALHNTIGGTVVETVGKDPGDWTLSTVQLRYVADTNDESVGYVKGRSGESHLAIVAMSNKATKDGDEARTNSVIVVTAYTAYVAGRVYQINGDCAVSTATSTSEWTAMGILVDAGLLPTISVADNRAESDFEVSLLIRDSARTVPINIDTNNLDTVLATARGHLWFPAFERVRKDPKDLKDKSKGK